jgi:hypothetical protein
MLALVLLACARHAPAPAPLPQGESAPTSTAPGAQLPALAPSARAALHRSCSTTSVCPGALACVEYCGVAGCRPGSVFHSCELPCGHGRPCPEGLSCGMVSDGPGMVCSEPGHGPRAPALPEALDR